MNCQKTTINQNKRTKETVKNEFSRLKDSYNIDYYRTYVYEEKTHKETYCPYMTVTKDDEIILILDFVDNNDEDLVICYKEMVYKCCNLFRYYSLIISDKLLFWEKPHEMLIEKNMFYINDDLRSFNQTKGKEMDIRSLVKVVQNYKNVTNEDFSLELCKKIESICYKKYNKGVLRENIIRLIDKWSCHAFV